MRISHSIYLYTCVYICVCIYMYIYIHIHIHANTNTTSIHTHASAQSSSSCTKLLKLLQRPTPPTSGQKTRMACMLIILRACAILYPNVDCVLLSYHCHTFCHTVVIPWASICSLFGYKYGRRPALCLVYPGRRFAVRMHVIRCHSPSAHVMLRPCCHNLVYGQ